MSWGNKWGKPIFAKFESGTPVNAVAGSYKVTALEFALLGNDETITVDDNVFVKVASATEADEFDDLAGLVALIDALDDFSSTATDGNSTVTITYATKGVIGNDKAVNIDIVSDTTANFNSGVTASNATIPAEDIAQLADGDEIVFDSNTFVFRDSATEANEFEDQAGLIVLMDALTDWGAADSSDDVVVTYKNNTEDADGIDIVINYSRVTANGVNGTPGKAGDSYRDASALYVLHVDNTISDANWETITYDS